MAISRIGAIDTGGCGEASVLRFHTWHIPTAVMQSNHHPRHSIITGCDSITSGLKILLPAGVHVYMLPSSHAAAQKFLLPVTKMTALGRKSCHSVTPRLVALIRDGSLT